MEDANLPCIYRSSLSPAFNPSSLDPNASTEDVEKILKGYYKASIPTRPGYLSRRGWSTEEVFLRTMHLHLLHKYIQDLGLHGVGSPTPPSKEDKSIQSSVSVTDKAVDTSEQDCSSTRPSTQEQSIQALVPIADKAVDSSEQDFITPHAQSPTGSPKDDTYREFFDTYMEIDPKPTQDAQSLHDADPMDDVTLQTDARIAAQDAQSLHDAERMDVDQNTVQKADQPDSKSMVTPPDINTPGTGGRSTSVTSGRTDSSSIQTSSNLEADEILVNGVVTKFNQRRIQEYRRNLATHPEVIERGSKFASHMFEMQGSAVKCLSCQSRVGDRQLKIGAELKHKNKDTDLRCGCPIDGALVHLVIKQLASSDVSFATFDDSTINVLNLPIIAHAIKKLTGLDVDGLLKPRRTKLALTAGWSLRELEKEITGDGMPSLAAEDADLLKKALELVDRVGL